MPGRLFLNRPFADVQAASALDVSSLCETELDVRNNIQPGQDVLTVTRDGWQMMRWGMIPVGRKNARGRPVLETIINARSESVFDKSAFDGVGRAVIPADGWYEWTGEKRRKQAWRIRRKDGALLWFAAIYDVWQGPGGINLPQVAAVTCEPNDDVSHVHHRMGVLLPREALPIWLGDDQAAAERVMVQPPARQLVVEKADDVDWNGP